MSKYTFENLTTNVVKLSIYDYGEGEAEILAVDTSRETLVVQWIYFLTCYSCQKIDETIYTTPDVISFDNICTIDEIKKISKNDIEKRREEYYKRDKKFGRIKTTTKISSEEIMNLDSVTKDEIYRMLWKEYVVEDVTQHLETRDDINKSSEEMIEMIDRIATRYVYDGEYDCNLPYWDNLDNLIEEEDKNTINHIIMD